MIDYREGKTRYIANKLGSLYIDESKLSDNERPVIYIGGQMEHRWHVLEQTGKTLDPGHNMFTGNWFYDYPINLTNKEIVNAKNFAANLEEALDAADLNDVDFITHSFGGNVASLLTKNERVHKVYAVHPPITGTPLANPKCLNNHRNLFDLKEKLELLILKLVVNEKYGFEKDSYNGVNLNDIDLNKLVVIGSSLNPKVEKGSILDLYNWIKLETGYENDGVVVFDSNLFDNLGINYVKEDNHYNHFNSDTEYAFENAYKLSKKMR